MKKLPLALGALAISTVGATGLAGQTWAEPYPVQPANTGNFDELPLKITKVNPRANEITFIINDLPDDPFTGFIEMSTLGTPEDTNNQRQYMADRHYLGNLGVGWRNENSETIVNGWYQDFGAVNGVETVIPSTQSGATLTKNTSGIIYYIGWLQSQEWFGGKIDYSGCINTVEYQTAGADDVFECRAEANVNSAGYHYQPYLNGERLNVQIESTQGEEPQTATEEVAVENTKTEVEQRDTSDDAPKSATSNAVDNATSDAADNGAGGAYYTYTTVTNEGSASENSENTGVADEYATNADVWAVDESKVWEDGAGAETVETPELGEEDCGHFWPLVIGWGLAVLGWGGAAVLALKKRK